MSVSMFPRTLLALIPLLGLLPFLCCFRRTLLFLARRFLALFNTIRFMRDMPVCPDSLFWPWVMRVMMPVRVKSGRGRAKEISED